MPAQEVFFNQSLNINSVDLQNAGQSKIKKLFEELEEDKKE
ncbi:10172_t:CDS:1, partial [Funneliformis geosporum]